MHEIITGYKKNIIRVLNKVYVHNIKKILAEPTRRFLHTSVSSINTYHLQQGRINPEYLIVLCKTYPSEGNKRLLRICRAIWLVASLHLQEALLKVHPYVQVLLAVRIGSLTNHSM
jgi:hypothetical protein